MTIAQLLSIMSTAPEGKVGRISLPEYQARQEQRRKAKARWIALELRR